MEMEEITKEPERYVGVGEGTSATEKVKIEEEAEKNLYSSLQNPTEDLYSEAKFLPGASEKKDGSLGLQDVRLWRGVSACLGVICLLLILGIVLLHSSHQNAAALCQETPPNYIIAKPAAVHKRFHSDQCTKGWVQYGGLCFFLSSFRKTWDDAQKNCSAAGGNLAVISSPSVQRFLTENGRVSYWIGLRHDQTWTWVDRRRLTQSYWSDEPSTGNCVLLKGDESNDKNWFRSSCTRRTYYICERKVPDN